MSNLPNLFPGFGTERIHANGLTFHCRVAGAGSPVVLLHGYPQTHVCWHRVAPRLAANHSVVVMDLRGYGASSAPGGGGSEDPHHQQYAKRTMARDVIAVMATLGHKRFAVVGHDRGARVAYRLVLDMPDVVSRLVILDILPTVEQWDLMRWQGAIRSYHWGFLAQPEPLPERLIAGAPAYYVDHTLASWTRDGTLSALDPGALTHYQALLAEPERTHAICEDYRAGATFDRQLDEHDRAAERRIDCPTLVLWGTDYLGKGAVDPLTVWQRWCSDVRGQAIVSGHFLAEENPTAVLDQLVPFLDGAT